MAQNSSIEWTDTTWNPLAGCTRASEGCDNCYAAKMSLRLEAMALADIEAGKDPGGKRKYIGIATKNGKGIPAFNGKINLDYSELQRPYSWKKPRRVFVNSMSDLFHKDVPDNFVAGVFEVMKDNPQHTFQVLTKRPDRAAEFCGAWVWYKDNLPSNVWIGTSVENQQTAVERIPHLLKIPAAVRFLSCEPLLGPVDLTELVVHPDGSINALSPMLLEDMWEAWRDTSDDWENDFNEWFNVGDGSTMTGPQHPGIQWVIVGGESGPHARPMHPAWARSLRDQCQAAGIAFHFKQWGEWSLIQKDTPFIYKGLDTGDLHDARKSSDFGVLAPDGEWYHQHTGWNGRPIDPDTGEAYMVKVGKKAAGRLLDGREHNQFPAAAGAEAV